MRTLKLKRKKTFVGCLCKIRIFIEDAQGDLEISGLKCKQIGLLKNGAIGEYQIPNEKVVLFVVYSKVAPQKYHAECEISADPNNKDVVLYTGPELNPMAGNPFNIYTENEIASLGDSKGWDKTKK